MCNNESRAKYHLLHFLFLIYYQQVKCYKYWPTEDSDLLFNSLQITLNSEETYPCFVIRKISLIDVEVCIPHTV